MAHLEHCGIRFLGENGSPSDNHHGNRALHEQPPAPLHPYSDGHAASRRQLRCPEGAVPLSDPQGNAYRVHRLAIAGLTPASSEIALMPTPSLYILTACCRSSVPGPNELAGVHIAAVTLRAAPCLPATTVSVAVVTGGAATGTTRPFSFTLRLTTTFNRPAFQPLRDRAAFCFPPCPVKGP